MKHQYSTSKPYYSVVHDLLGRIEPLERILDAPCGNGWLGSMIESKNLAVVGVDAQPRSLSFYCSCLQADLNEGLPDDIGLFQAIVSCEGIEHLGNPLLFMKSCRSALADGGTLIITTPNTWYPGSKLKHFFRGFFPSFPPLPDVAEMRLGEHMHITPWTFPQLHLYLTLAGFTDVTLHEVPNDLQPKHWYEIILGLPQRLYCKKKGQQAKSAEGKKYWRHAGSKQSVYGRRLVVSACKGVQ